MKLRGLIFLAASFVMLCSLVLAAQSEQEYKDPDGTYVITLMGDWKAVSYKDAVGRQKTEFVYRDRSEGLLKITKENLMDGDISSLVRQEEENLKMYRAGFERASTEGFGAGELKGVRFSFYNTDSRRQKASTYYYLQNGNTVWVLRFTGARGSLDTIRNITDQMARSFRPL